MGMSAGRAGMFGLIAAAAVAVWAAPAMAHVEVSADEPQAGASDVTLSFVAESEHDTAGIVSLEVVLPEGIAPEDVAWVSGPTGWKLTTGEVAGEPGYTVAGPQVTPGADAAYEVLVATLPTDATELAFRTLQTYSDGHVDRWIELPQAGAELQEPAPVLTLAPAAAPSEPAEATPTGAASPTSPPAPATSNAAAPATDEGTAAWPWIVVAALVVLATAGGLLWWRRRAATGQPAGKT